MIHRREVLIGAAASALPFRLAHAGDGPPASRIVTTVLLDADPPALRVSWILWDSPFRGSGLRVGDRILAINGVPIPRAATTAERQHLSSTSLGAYAEDQGFAAAGLTVGAPVTLTLRRRRAGSGWETATVSAKLGVARFTVTADGQRTLGPGGPPEMNADGFNDSWSGWDEQTVRAYTQILDGGWEQASFSNRVELSLHAQRRPRVDYLLAHYPGTYANAARDDWDTVQACLQGALVTLPDGALDYRRAEDERIQTVRAAGQAAWQAAQDALGTTALPAFPAVHPIHGDLMSVVGRPVVLPPLGNDSWIAEAGHGWFTAGNESDNWYFIDAEAPPAIAMLRARERFERLVTPSITASYAFIGRISDQPKLIVVDDTARFGLGLTPTAVLVGEAMFVDLTAPADNPPFAGEAAFHQPPGATPPPDASPAAVMAALIAALKANDQALWNELFADWAVDYLPDGRPLLQPYVVRVSDDDWTRARASMLGRVYDARVLWTGDPRVVTDGQAYPGALRIEEVDVVIDHIGKFDDGYRVFTDTTVHRQWQLQRVNGGPWRIHSVQSI